MCFCQSSSAEIVEALFQINHMIKPHNIGKTLIKPCMSKAASFVLEKTYCKKMAKISLSDSTIKTSIDEFAKDMECQVLEKLQASLFYSIQCGDHTNIDGMSQLLVYVCFN